MQRLFLTNVGMNDIPNQQPPGRRQDTATPPESLAPRKGKRRQAARDTPRKRAARA